MAWVLVIVAGGFEAGWAIGLKLSHGFTRPVPAMLTLLGMAASFGCLTLAMRSLPVGTAYAVWTGVGATGAVALGILVLHEPVTWPRLISLSVIIAGLVGLKLAS